MNAVRPMLASAGPAVTFKAWSMVPGGQGYDRYEAFPCALPEWVETPEQAALHVAGPVAHKRSLMILRTDASLRPDRRNLVSLFCVRRRTRREYIRLPDGTTGRETELYPELIAQFCVADGFAPVEPWKVEDGNPVGNDLTLIEGVTA